MAQTAALDRPAAPLATSPFDRFPQPPYDPTRATTTTGYLSSDLELEAGGFLDLEAGGVLELEDTAITTFTQYRPGAVT